MGRSVSNATGVHPERIFTYSKEMIGVELAAFPVSAAAGTAAPAQGACFYIPLKIESTITVKSMAVHGSANGTSAKVDLGIYNSAGTKLVGKNATAVSFTDAWQTLDITDTTLVPGLYYAAVMLDTADVAASVYRFAVGDVTRNRLIYYEAVATGGNLPATATFGNLAADYIPVIAINCGTVTI